MVGRRGARVFALQLVAVVAVVVTTSVAARARPLSEVTFGYTRGPGAEACPGQATLQEAVLAKLGYDPFRIEAARHLEVVIAVEKGGLRATLRATEGPDLPPSTHRLSSSRLDCQTLHPALTLAIALAIDPATGVELDSGPQLPVPPPPRPFPKEVTVNAPLVERPPMPPGLQGGGEPVAAPRNKVTGVLYGGALVAIAAGPSTSGGFELGGGVVGRSFAALVELRGDVPTRAHSLAGDIEVARIVANVAPCFRVFTFGFCALASVGMSVLRGHGYVADRDQILPFTAFGARLSAEVPLGRRVYLGAHADLLGLAIRVNARVDATVGYSDPPATGAFGLVVGGRFGDRK